MSRLSVRFVKEWLNKMKVTDNSIFMQVKYSAFQRNSLVVTTNASEL